eukprot:m.211753 g.211753  ORF g.211753 m.211753 type:complete len:244 (+) comp18578_c0_seq2:237-968(+)
MCCGTKTWPGQDIAERGGGMTQTVLTFDYFALLFWRMFRLVAAVVNFVFREPLPGFAGPVPARGPRNPGTEPGKVPVSSQRFDYAAPKDDLASGGGDRSGWHAGNTSRYGHNSRPWAKASSAAAGIVPVASPRSHSLASKVPVTRDEFDAGASLSKPAPAKTDEEAMEKWIRGSQTKDGAAVKRIVQNIPLKPESTQSGSFQPGVTMARKQLDPKNVCAQAILSACVLFECGTSSPTYVFSSY